MLVDIVVLSGWNAMMFHKVLTSGVLHVCFILIPNFSPSFSIPRNTLISHNDIKADIDSKFADAHQDTSFSIPRNKLNTHNEIKAHADFQIETYQDISQKIIDFVTKGGGKHQTYDRLAAMTDKFGNRLVGSENLERVIDYMFRPVQSGRTGKCARWRSNQRSSLGKREKNPRRCYNRGNMKCQS